MQGQNIAIVDQVIDNALADFLFRLMKDAEWERNFNAHSIYPGRKGALLAFSGEGRELSDIVAFMTYIFGEDDPQANFMVNVLYVLPDHRGQGIGEQLMRYASDMAVKAGSVEFGLHVKEANTPMRKMLDKLRLDQEPYRYNLILVPEPVF